MKKTMIFLILLVSLFGCGTTNNDEKNRSEDTKITNDMKQVDDFQVEITVDEELNVIASITYIGEESEKNIYHGGSIFFFNIYQQDGDFEYLGAMDLPLLTTTLVQNEPHQVKFVEMEQIDLEPGTYAFEAMANFSLDADDFIGTNYKITVSTIVEVK